MSLITLSTDFGTKDPDLGRLKGDILNLIPNAELVDVSHNITPYNTEEAVYIIQHSLPHFPKGSIHLIGFNSETHLNNQPILIQANGQYFMGNDNGILLKALNDFETMNFKLNDTDFKRFMQPHIRAAQKIINKTPIHNFATPTNDLHQLNLVQPKLVYAGNAVNKIVTRVIYTDNYGNAVFNIKKKEFETWRQQRNFVIKTGIVEIDAMLQNYNDYIKSRDDISKYAGKAMARFNDNEHLEVFIYHSNRQTGGANTLLGLRNNMEIIIQFD